MKKDTSFGIVPIILSERGLPRFLLIHQTVGHWAFPKGHPEENETPIESARRELMEETGVSNIRMLDGYSYIQNYLFEKEGEQIEKTVTFFAGFVEDEKVVVNKDEVQDFEWLCYQDALERLTYEDSKQLVKDVYARLRTEGLLKV
jgi:8-oxo-dGTP pyrophosphatase MutT (NUDIX family)